MKAIVFRPAWADEMTFGKPTLTEPLVIFTESTEGPVYGLDDEIIRREGGKLLYVT